MLLPPPHLLADPQIARNQASRGLKQVALPPTKGVYLKTAFTDGPGFDLEKSWEDLG